MIARVDPRALLSHRTFCSRCTLLCQRRENETSHTRARKDTCTPAHTHKRVVQGTTPRANKKNEKSTHTQPQGPMPSPLECSNDKFRDKASASETLARPQTNPSPPPCPPSAMSVNSLRRRLKFKSRVCRLFGKKKKEGKIWD